MYVSVQSLIRIVAWIFLSVSIIWFAYSINLIWIKPNDTIYPEEYAVLHLFATMFTAIFAIGLFMASNTLLSEK